MMGIDATMVVTDDELKTHLDKRDAGTGIIIARHYEQDFAQYQYQVAVIDGRFDGHRNDLGELWVNEFELSEIPRR